MAITIPALLDTQLDALQAALRPVQNGTTLTASFVAAPYPLGNRIADIMRLLIDLCDSGTLTATGGTATTVSDTGAFTGVNSLVNCTATFNGNVTAALAGVSATILSNTVDALTFAPGALPGTPAAGDTFTVAWTAIDKDLAKLDEGKGLSNSASNPYGPGPSLINALLVATGQLGATPSAELTAAAAQPFGLGSPHAGGETRGSAGAIVIAALLEEFRDAIEAYTAPA